jgi:phage terminase Nu1 subunit (DNA packaging protein)
MSDKIKVISTYDGRCGIDDADLRISRRWPARGAVVTFTKEQLDELQFNMAFMNMVREGMLYIEDMEVKKEMGVEPEDATIPTIILMDEKQLRRFWKDMPISQFKAETKTLTKAQIEALAEYAIRHGDEGSIDKANYLTKISGYQILKGIELERQSKEE